MTYIAVLDGQGGGIGRALIEQLKPQLPSHARIIAFGTNALATAAMLKAGAHEGATGEHAIIQSMPRMHVIAGPIGIVLAGAMWGEISPAIAAAIAQSPARRILIPMVKCQTEIAGMHIPLQETIEDAVMRIVKHSSDSASSEV